MADQHGIESVAMKILHTSDWHLGRSLYGRKRYAEFAAFLDWLVQTIEDENIDALLVAGDVFDTSTPGHLAQELYYRFLFRVSRSCCRHVVVIAGNHDSPSFLNAPKELLRALNVHVVGAMTENPEDEVICLSDSGSQDAAVICAVPYLRDRDIRMVEPGETIDDKNLKLVEGLKAHYEKVVKIAEHRQEQIMAQSSIQNPQSPIPIIAMGHLFTAGGRTVDGDGVRELYVGSLAHVEEAVFPLAIDYLALGHLHVPQAVGTSEHIRYSGSPIPMGYGEAAQQKSVVISAFGVGLSKPKIRLLPVPCFQPLVRIVGSLDDIHAKVEDLKKKESTAWLEIEYTGSDIIANLREMLDDAIADSAMEIRRIKNKRVMDRVMGMAAEGETLDDLDPGDVFARCLDASKVPDEDREELTVSYNEILRDLMENDPNAQ